MVGLVLLALALVATVWLGATGKLTLYIHPRYLVFTLVMAGIALAAVIAAIAFARRRHRHDGEDGERYGVVGVTAVVIAGAVAIAMVVIPPATLTTGTAEQRELNSAAITGSGATLEEASSASDAAFASFTVLDWSSLLRQTTDPSFYSGKAVDVVGFVTADSENPERFYLSRFVVTCCAVDAQPIGVPVYLPGWEDQYAVGDWLRVTGGFASTPSGLALDADALEEVPEPDEPYLF